MATIEITPSGPGWAVGITPDTDETWPEIQGKPSRRRNGRIDQTVMTPDLILLWCEGNQVSVFGSGLRQLRDGGDGLLRVNAPWRTLNDLPVWGRRLVSSGLNALAVEIASQRNGVKA